MEWFDDQIKKSRAASISKDTEGTSGSKAFARLKQRFIEQRRDLTAGMSATTGITLGELVDVCAMYCQLASGGSDMAVQSLQRIASKQTPQELWSQAWVMVQSIFGKEDVDTTSREYLCPINLGKIIEERTGGFNSLSRRINGVRKI
jgi:hypothetical protein